MKIGKVITGIALIVLGILLISMFWSTIGAKTAEQVWEDYDLANGNFKSYDAGDTVLIKDEIKNITYFNITKLTMIVFKGKNWDIPFLFKGDLTGEYKKGDTVLIILKVEKKNNIESFEGNLTSDKIHKLYLGGNAFFCGIILIGVLVLIYGLLKKKPKPVYYAPQPYPAQPMAPQYPPQPPVQYPPPPQYQQPAPPLQPQVKPEPPLPQMQPPTPPAPQVQPTAKPEPPPPQIQQSSTPPSPPLQPPVKPEPTAQAQPQPVESQQPVPQLAKKGLFQRLKIGKKEQPQPTSAIPSEKMPALEQPALALEIKPPVHEPVQSAQQPTVEKPAPTPKQTLQVSEKIATFEPLQPAPQIPKFCPNCGAETKGHKFCGNCGAKLAG